MPKRYQIPFFVRRPAVLHLDFSIPAGDFKHAVWHVLIQREDYRVEGYFAGDGAEAGRFVSVKEKLEFNVASFGGVFLVGKVLSVKPGSP